MRLALILGLVGLIATQQLQGGDAFRLLGTGKLASSSLSLSPAKSLSASRLSLQRTPHKQFSAYTRNAQWRVQMSEAGEPVVAEAVPATHTHTETHTETHAHTQTEAVDMDLVVTDAPAAVSAAGEHVASADAASAPAQEATLSAEQAMSMHTLTQAQQQQQQLLPPATNYVQNEFSVFVGKLPFGITEELLNQVVRQRLGEQCAVESVKLVTNKYTGRSKGFGYVNFASKENTELGAQLLKGLAFDNVECHVDVASYPSKDGRREQKPRMMMQPGMNMGMQGMQGAQGTRGPMRTTFTPRRTAEEEEMRSRCSIHVSNVPGAISTDQLKSEFEANTGFTPLEITMYPPMPNNLFGYCFVRLNSEEEVLKVLEKMSSFTLSTGEGLTMKRSIFRERQYTVFIGNLPFGADDGLMRDMFHDVLGENRFKRVFVGKDQFGRSRGYAFGVFDNAMDAKNAIAMINGMELLGRVLRAEKGSNPRKPRPFGDSRGDNFQGNFQGDFQREQSFGNGAMPADAQLSG